jgi:BioD-like phosphotransacetylase family protein
MGKTIYLSSLGERAGKSFIAIGMMQKLQKDGYTVGYLNPIGVTRYVDSDLSLDVSSVMGITSPVSLPDSYYIDLVKEKKIEYLEKITTAYEDLKEGMDYIIIEGRSLRKFSNVGLDDISIVQALGIDEIILIEGVSSDITVDNLSFVKSYLKSRKFKNKLIKVKGVIFNQIDFDYIARIKELEEYIEFPVLGIIEKKFSLSSPRVTEIISGIGGVFVNEEGAKDGINRIVEAFIIGAMNTSAALKHLRQVKNAVIITGGDRVDLALAALNEDPACLILTGFIQPDITIVSAANEKGIPVILSPSDTYTTIRNIERIKPGVQQDEITLAAELVEDLDWEKILK